MTTPRILVSVLNWNKAAVTLRCLASLEGMDRAGMAIDILVIDNGSAPSDHAALAAGIAGLTGVTGVQLQRIETNLGFTGGQNVSLRRGMQDGHDYVWMLNNDAIVEPDTLRKLVDAMQADPCCGAATPVIECEEGGNARGAMAHDWAKRETIWFKSEAAVRKQQQEQPGNLCVAGTAVLLRVEAIRATGLLDDRLFAYYDDNDIGVRLARAGWHSKVVFDARIGHGAIVQPERPPYYIYLMTRNDMLFWHTHTPPEHRKLSWLRLVDRSLYRVNLMRVMGRTSQAEVALLAVSDFIFGNHGAPRLGRRVALPTRLLYALSGLVYRNKLRAAGRESATQAASGAKQPG